MRAGDFQDAMHANSSSRKRRSSESAALAHKTSGPGRRLTFICAFAALIAVLARGHAASSQRIAQGAACGIERWAVKTLMDPGAASLPGAPRDTTIGSLRALPAPRHPEWLAKRLPPLETTLWKLQNDARLVGYRIEADSDMHLVLADARTGATMIGEIPAPYCTTSPKASLFAAARRAVERIGHHAATRRWWWLDYHGATPPLLGTVEGYGFWDASHDQTGASPNNAELHPVIFLGSR